jgi:lipoprotein-releasing system permease protein
MGVHIGEKGSLHFAAHGAASSQEQRISMQAVGFYDPGLFAMGGRCLIVPSSITRTIHAATQTFSPDGTPTNGIFIWSDLNQIEDTQKLIEKNLAQSNLQQYWKVDSFKDFEFSKELFQQFHSDRTLFLMIAILILLVACCNIISLLVLLVNDKKREIAILHAMGASRGSIAAIFGLAGLAMGALSSLIGVGAAIFSLHHLDTIVSWLSRLQGHAAFQPAFFGQSLPSELSIDALLFVLIATPLLSLIAGLIPALRASRIRPATALRQS